MHACLVIMHTNCRSVNEVICHGIPDGRELQDGDICNGEDSPTNTGLLDLVIIVLLLQLTSASITVVSIAT